MQIKVVKAPSMKEAMEEVKSELGRDAVILHTKKYREGGFLGYHSKDVVEVTAAIEDAPERGQKRAPKAVEETPPKPRTGERPLPVFPANILNQYKTFGYAKFRASSCLSGS